MKLEIKKGTTSKLIEIFISDSSQVDGSGLTGVAFGDITGYYYRSGAGAEVVFGVLKTMTLGTWVTEGFIEIDATNMPGYYQLGLPNAALAVGADQVNIMLKGATNMAPLPIEIQLVDNIEKDSYDILNHADYGNSKLVRSTTPANSLDVDSDGNVTASNIVSGGGNLNASAESYVETTGNVVSGSIANTKAIDSVYHQIEDVAGTLDIYYEFDITSFGSPATVNIIGRVNGLGDDLTIYAYNWGGVSWESLGDYLGQGSSVDVDRLYTLFNNHVGTGANLGKVRIRFEGTGLTGADLYIDRITLGYTVVPSITGYEGGAVWLDTINGTPGTTTDYNGIASRPVDSIADALTLANNIGLKKIIIAIGSNITFAASMDGFILEGFSWSLSLGGQSCSGAHIIGADVSGICTGVAEPHFINCVIGVVTLPPCAIENSGFEGVFTLGNIGNYHFHNTHSHNGSFIIDFDSLGNNEVGVYGFDGNVEFRNMGQSGSDEVVLSGRGEYVINANCIGGVFNVFGSFTKTDNSGGSVTVNEEARYEVQQIRDSMKLAPTAGADGSGSVDDHLDNINIKAINIAGFVRHSKGISFPIGVPFYLDPVNGNDSNDGLTPQNAKLTSASALSLCTAYNQDSIVLVNSTGGLLSWDQKIDINVAKVHFIGDGNTRIKPTSSGAPTVILSAIGTHLEGLQIETHIAGNENGVEITASECEVHNVKIPQSRASGIVINGADDCIIHNVVLRNPGSGGNGHGIQIIGNSTGNRINDFDILGAAGDGINLNGVNVNENIISSGDGTSIIHECIGWGIREQAGANNNRIIGPNLLVEGNTEGNFNLDLTTINQNTTQYSTSAQAILIQALSGKNNKMFNTSYDGNGNLTGATIRLFPSKSDLEADVGGHIGELTLVGVYSAPGQAISHIRKDSI